LRKSDRNRSPDGHARYCRGLCNFDVIVVPFEFLCGDARNLLDP
jgi:hypothetical protein